MKNRPARHRRARHFDVFLRPESFAQVWEDTVLGVLAVLLSLVIGIPTGIGLGNLIIWLAAL